MKHYLQSLRRVIIEHWDSKALCDYHGDSFTFGELYEQIKRLHSLFDRFGIREGDKIAICGHNHARWGIGFLAANSYRAVAVPILSDFTPDSICSILNHSESVLLFADEEIWKNIDSAKLQSVKRVLCLSDFSLLYGSDRESLAFAEAEQAYLRMYPSGMSAGDVILPDDNDGDLAIINYTSGSTGDPKGVMLRYECLSANTEYAQNNVPCHPGDSILSILPMAHMFGLEFELLYPLCSGATINYLGRTPSPSLLLKAMQEVRPYLVIAVPMIFEKIYRNRLKPVLEKPSMRFLISVPGLRRVIFSKMRRTINEAFGGKVREFIMGGAAVNPEVEDFFKRIGLYYTVGYGMTEAAPLLAYSPWRTFAPHSCGRAMDFVKLRIASENPETEVGEIQVKGVSLFSGYFKNERATKAAFSDDGWFNTGDLGLIDKDGNVYIKGRSKSMLLSSNGQNIYPEEIECVINNLDYVTESLVVSRDSKLVALVQLDENRIKNEGVNQDLIANGIKLEVNSKVPGYSKLFKVEILSEPFQKTPKLTIKRFLYR